MTGMEKLVQVATCLKKKKKRTGEEDGSTKTRPNRGRGVGGSEGGSAWGLVLFAAAVQFNWPDVKVLFSPEGFSSARISFRISRSN